jgi:hypothetical protein
MMGKTTAKTLSSLKGEDWVIWKRPPLQRVQIISHNGDQECNAILWRQLVIGGKLVTSKCELGSEIPTRAFHAKLGLNGRRKDVMVRSSSVSPLVITAYLIRNSALSGLM